MRRDWNRRLRYVTGVTSKSPSENVGSTVIMQKFSPSVQNLVRSPIWLSVAKTSAGSGITLIARMYLEPFSSCFAANIISYNSSAGFNMLFFCKYITCRSLRGSWPEQLALEIPPIIAETFATVCFGPLELLSLLISCVVLGHVGKKGWPVFEFPWHFISGTKLTGIWYVTMHRWWGLFAASAC